MRTIKIYSNESQPPCEVTACGIYAHGKLEDKLMHDIIYIPIHDFNQEIGPVIELKEKGIYNVEVAFNDEFIKAKLYYWQAMRCGSPNHRGLVVLEDDIEAIDYVLDKYTNDTYAV